MYSIFSFLQIAHPIFHCIHHFSSPQMNSRLFFQSPFLILFIIITLVLVQIPVFLCFNWYSSCSNKYNCGDVTNIGYPFWGDIRDFGCGNLSLFLSCKANITFIEINYITYRALGAKNATKILKIARADFNGGVCSLNHVNTTLDSNLLFTALATGLLNLSMVVRPECLPALEVVMAL